MLCTCSAFPQELLDCWVPYSCIARQHAFTTCITTQVISIWSCFCCFIGETTWITTWFKKQQMRTNFLLYLHKNEDPGLYSPRIFSVSRDHWQSFLGTKSSQVPFSEIAQNSKLYVGVLCLLSRTSHNSDSYQYYQPTWLPWRRPQDKGLGFSSTLSLESMLHLAVAPLVCPWVC